MGGMENDIGSMRGSWGWKKVQLGLTLTCRKQQEKRFKMNNVEIRNLYHKGHRGAQQTVQAGSKGLSVYSRGSRGSCCPSARGTVGV